MHLLIATLGSAGDVHPFLAIGKAAQARGHRVTLCTSPVFQGLVERCGLGFRPIGTAEAFLAAMADPALWHPRTSLRTLWGVIAPTIEAQYRLLQAEIGGDTVMLGALWAFGARLLHETSGVPYLSAQVSPSTMLSAVAPPTHAGFAIPAGLPLPVRRMLLRLIEAWAIDPLMTPALDDTRRRLGLTPVRRVMTRWVHAPQGMLTLFPEWFAAVPRDIPGTHRQCGFPLFETPGSEGLDAELETFLAGGSRPVVITAGSTGLDGTRFFKQALQAVQAGGRRAVLLGGPPGSVPELPATALHRDFVSLPALFARSSALIHHGGIGTAAFALAAGLPQLLVPFAHDQFDNAERVAALACGLRCDARDAGTQLRPRLEQLLADTALQASCQRIRRRMAQESGAAACASVVDALEAALHGEPLAA